MMFVEVVVSITLALVVFQFMAWFTLAVLVKRLLKEELV